MTVVDLRMTERVARVVLDRPPLNVVDLGMARDLAARLEEARRRPGLAAVLLAGRGKAFCAGVDVRDHLPDRGAEMLREFHRACVVLLEIEVPVVAAVHGAALGGGCELTLACDIVIASDRATFGQPEIKLGVLPPLASVALPRRIPPALAADLLLTGRTLSAADALACGLVSRVAPAAEFEAAVESLLGELAAMSPASLRLAKEALKLAGGRPSPAEIAAAERFYVEKVMSSADAIEGLQAFLEKRPPRWTAG